MKVTHKAHAILEVLANAFPTATVTMRYMDGIFFYEMSFTAGPNRLTIGRAINQHSINRMPPHILAEYMARELREGAGEALVRLFTGFDKDD